MSKKLQRLQMRVPQRQTGRNFFFGELPATWVPAVAQELKKKKKTAPPQHCSIAHEHHEHSPTVAVVVVQHGSTLPPSGG